MPAVPEQPNERGLTLLLDEYFQAEDVRFVETLRQVRSPKFLATFTDRWKKDPRPWARQQIFNYLEQPLDRQGHQPVVKRLFKHAEENKDHELMALFLVLFDRLVRRVRRKQWHWDRSSRQSYQEEVLWSPRNSIPSQTAKNARNPATGDSMVYQVRQKPGDRLFTYHTRYYLRRRAWRYFRRLGFQHPEAYPQAITKALARYRDEDLARGENILDSWGLLHACFGKHPALEFQTSQAVLKDGHSLSELSAAPVFPELWKTQAAAEALLVLLFSAQSHLVRLWSMHLLRSVREAVELSPDTLLRLLEHESEEVQQFGAEWMQSMPGMDKMPVPFWLKLLKTKNPTALQSICEAFQKHVSAERLSLEQCIDMACVAAVPVSRLGFDFLRPRVISGRDERAALVKLADAQCAATAKDLSGWALKILGAVYDLDQVLRFFDARLQPVREAAWEWLNSEGSPGYDDPILWSRLTETPYDDLRLRLIDQLEKRSQLPGASPETLTTVWTSVLLGVHRGGRQKAKAVRQLGQAMVEDPSKTETLLPVLAVAVRSSRLPEMRAGLAALAGALSDRPELEPLLKKYLPEVRVLSEEVVA